jgi:hypothetical protein
MSQKVVQYQAVMQLAQTAPQMYDLPYLHRQMLDVLGIKNASKLVPMQDDQKPRDPVSENMALLTGKPIKAFIYQDHAAHIQVHMALIKDPKIAQLIGQSPMAQQMSSAAMAHIQEHVAFEYRKQLEDQLGVPYPYSEDGEGMTEDMELELSRLAAAGAKKLLAKDETEMAAQKAQQAAQDPIVQMQQMELKLKAQELEIKKQKVTLDAAAKADEIELEKARLESDREIAGMQVGAKTAKDKAELAAKMELEGVRLGSEIAHNKAQVNRPEKKGNK